ncbi:MAG TPA: tripartite tricarboxylate transporter substrate binding protein [Mesorhizobium sp.]|jgi:tripartite-type tricarboxylate transporter receptor subunit TctC
MSVRSLLAAMAISLAFGAVAKAQDYPNRPITIIVPYTAGGGADVVARITADGLERQLKQRVIIENVTGAGGTTGIRRAANAAPDGYTMMTVSPGTHSAAPALYKDLGYDPIKSFEMVGLTATQPLVLIVRKELPVSNLKEFVTYLKAHEKTVTLAHVGPGSMTHLGCTMFDALVGVNPTAAPYRGTPPLMQDLLGGRVDYTCQQPNGVIGFVQKGEVKALAVAGDKRMPSLPNVPTSDEAGMPDFKSSAWNALAMPKGVPDAIVNKVNAALNKALNDPDVIKRFATLDLVVPPPEERSREYMLKFMKIELDRYVDLMRKAGVEPQ